MAQAKVLARDSVQRNSPSGSTSNNSTLGIVFMSLGIFCYACSNAFVKETAPNYPIGEILFFRSLFFFIPLSLYLLLSKGIKGTKATLKTVHMRVYVIRGFLSAISLFFIFLAFKLLPFAEASALSFSGTFFVTLLSIPLLKEHVGWHRWGALFIGFAGILLIVQPTNGVLALVGVGAAAALLGAFIDAIVMIYGRILSRSDSNTTIVFYYALYSLIASTFALSLGWVTPSQEDLLRLIGVSAGSGIGQVFITHAFRNAEASSLSPMIYTLMLWGVLFGYLFWGEVPTSDVLTGSAIIIASGLYIFQRESRARKKSLAAAV